jgi:hypothetical protein
MLKLLFNPSEAIDRAKTRKSFGLSFLTCVLGSLYLGITAFLLSFFVGFQTVENSLLFGLSLFIGFVVASFYSGWLLDVIMTTLVGKGTFWAGFTTRVYAMYIVSFAGLIASVLWAAHLILKNNLLTWGVYAAYLLLGPIVIAQALSAHLKAQKELYNTNMTVALVGLVVLMIVAGITAMAFSNILAQTIVFQPMLIK